MSPLKAASGEPSVMCIVKSFKRLRDRLTYESFGPAAKLDKQAQIDTAVHHGNEFEKRWQHHQTNHTKEFNCCCLVRRFFLHACVPVFCSVAKCLQHPRFSRAVPYHETYRALTRLTSEFE